jgi:predicted DNA-binding transcriptional regulator YafY
MSEQKITKLQRFQLLRQTLLGNPMSLQDLIDWYALQGVARSLRQIQRDLKELEQSVVETESVQTFYVRKIKYYILETSATENHTPPVIKGFIHATNFYKPTITVADEQKIALIQKAIATGKRVGVSKIINDKTGDNAQFENQQIELVPIELLLHRNNYYVGSYHLKKQCIVFFNIKQMISVIGIEKKGKAERYWEAYTHELNARFGITKNIDNTIYDIKIEIANVLVSFIQNHHWHPSQKITKEKSHYYLHLRCGINRELLGWLCLWMYNIKIIHPPILQDYYFKTLRKMQGNLEKQIPLVYRNIFVNEAEEVRTPIPEPKMN